MAGEWIPVRTDLRDSPKVVRIVSALCPQACASLSDKARATSLVVGGLHGMWSLFDAYTDDGILRGYCAKTLDSVVGIEGFSDLVAEVGWLELGTQTLTMPDFELWLSKSAKRRLKENQRKRGARKTPSAKRPHGSGQKAPNSRGEDITVEEKETPYPLPLDTARFREVWSGWLDYRREIGKSYKTARGMQNQLGRLAKWGEARACDAIEYSIAQESQGIYEERAAKVSGAGGHADRVTANLKRQLEELENGQRN